MKYHVAVKFIAIVLCAVCLLGAVGSAAGIFVLTEMDLYNNTVDQVLENELRNSGMNFARNAVLYYASIELGGCPEELAQEHYMEPAVWGISRYGPDDYGYAILDGEGNELFSSHAERKEGGKIYTFPVTGQYLHLVSQEPEDQEETYPDNDVYQDIISTDSLLNGEYGVYENIPKSGTAYISGITVDYVDDNGNVSSEGYGSADSMGILFRDARGSVEFHSTDAYSLSGFGEAGDITHIIFQDEQGIVVYEAAAPGKIGRIENDEGYITFTADLYLTGPAAEAETEPTEPTEPEPVDLTQHTEVYHAEFYSAEEPGTVSFQVISGGSSIGLAWYGDSGVLYVAVNSLTDPSIGQLAGTITAGPVGGIRLYDSQERELVHYQGEGKVVIGEGGGLWYESAGPTADMASRQDTASVTAAVAETAPQATAETTAGETVPVETAGSETVPQETSAAAVTASAENETAPTEETQTVPTATVETVPVTTAATVPETTKAASPSGLLTMPEPTEPVLINGKPITEFAKTTTVYYNRELEEHMRAQCAYVPLPGEYTVELYIAEDSTQYEAAYALLRIVRNFRNDLFLILGLSLLLFAVFAVYLCCAAGHKPKSEEIRAGGLSRVPLDLNLTVTGGFVAAMVVGVAGCVNYLVERNLSGCIALGVGLAFLACLSLVGFLYAAAAQFKTPDGYWWRNSLCYRAFSGIVRCAVWAYRWLTGRFFPWLGRFVKLAVKFLERTVMKLAAWTGGGVRKFFGLLPLIWQWILGGGLILFLGLLAWANRHDGWGTLWLMVGLGLIVYISQCFGVLLKAAKRMCKGDLNTKVDDKRMVGCFREFAGDLNDLADVAVVAAQKQLKSERMKTELITNVSHDIKTPLTSIINYVDLLQKPHTGEEEAMYLEVLARQSQRLKKLIEDLMEMSKASTGNMSVDITKIDAIEAVNQALGEFGDKLDKAMLIPVFRHGDEPAMMMADGRLVWRVLSNLLGNAVKYAMPGTRLYIDLMKLEGKVVISLKNISRDELNVDAEELMERFVRGDDSRNTEGSGLGLNIARSLMELQKGQLQLLVDGDLFKVTLIFPGV